jgi:hypothetical protein
MWTGDRTPKEKAEYGKMNPKEKEKERDSRTKRQQSECEDSSCDNDATNFGSTGSRGRCTSHNTDDDD